LCFCDILQKNATIFVSKIRKVVEYFQCELEKVRKKCKFLTITCVLKIVFIKKTYELKSLLKFVSKIILKNAKDIENYCCFLVRASIYSKIKGANF